MTGRGHIWLSLVGLELEVGTKVREAASDGSSPGPFGLIVPGVILLPVLLLETAVWLPTGLIQAGVLGRLPLTRGWLAGRLWVGVLFLGMDWP